MLKSNLSVLLAERNLKSTKVANDTGISRTTLTSLCKNHAQGIQFDTINTLCMYLQVDPAQLLLFTPIDIDVKGVAVEDDYYAIISLAITQNRSTTYCNLDAHLNLTLRHSTDYDHFLTYASVLVALSDNEEHNHIISSTFKQLERAFLTDIECHILDLLVDELTNTNIQIGTPCDFSFAWNFL